ncbi:hypothetical protein MCBMB27_02131 [Methylobacterium phyllosphaerae]|uniref:Uncharacterized protein n=1 Tax=Methylobacterium phyllosphaerae TaxID=418223 RepID=A0AAE8L5S6_9HYPH|nr:hypothetical protein [Methylobacterium phyllosphaerae]APT31422.1 hypothetical protein MCBMB27_02131 [Methylobacterium phyllosphaerae]SFG65168.1 hypothetical protein SAMN05192567_10681 [Methylobacterium phyllosphaerae]
MLCVGHSDLKDLSDQSPECDFAFLKPTSERLFQSVEAARKPLAA